jgi:hypothetical protein
MVPCPPHRPGQGRIRVAGRGELQRAGLEGCRKAGPMLGGTVPPPKETLAYRRERSGGGCRETPPSSRKRNQVKQTPILNRADKHFPTAPLIVDELLLNEIVVLLAEILVLDFQGYMQITVSSPPQTNRKFLPNSSADLLDSAEQFARHTLSAADTSPDSIKEAL